ncbi:3-isopropylmalate dehydrogenase [[Clostridium] propionicum DSM 1682]|uniref:3-isopropylmalate dehydrogenase n=2 Tax=Anaerotignum propionicum TaxID=28446 RepID=A0A0X8V9F8_ANAPI|nr:3-isopropylmalate dehydrogenase [Anaerotignum propionicum DSM 1682]SHE39505.1 3-isopropylmalate dehydrogenase [[Clostridium] propionicum DSM 1682] [Anaerotignum propionicum DSM 1682]
MIMGEYKIAVIQGDGIGPEVTQEAIKILNVVGEKFHHNFTFEYALAGGSAIDACGECLPKETLNICKTADGVILGAVGGPKWDNVPNAQRPEKALLGLRSELGLFSNLRPAKIYDALADACPLKAEIVAGGLDILIVRELTGGIYFGERGYREGKYGEEAYDVETYSEVEIRRILKNAFEVAMQREKRVCCVDKANVLETSRLWRKVAEEIKNEYPEVVLSYMYVDNAAMQLVRNPKQFDVIVTSNMFGDILSDEASMITGSIGLLPSASLGDSSHGMYEPIHGSAPDIAGQNKANPIAAILSAGMMLKYSFHLEKESEAIENAVKAVLEQGLRTPDIYSQGTTLLGTKEMGEAIAEHI